MKALFQHDPDTKMCSPGSQNGGNYIMYDKVRIVQGGRGGGRGHFYFIVKSQTITDKKSVYFRQTHIQATNGDLPHNNLLSLCSRQDILDVLLTPAKTSCFRGSSLFRGPSRLNVLQLIFKSQVLTQSPGCNIS